MNVNVNVMERQGNVAVYGFGFSSIHIDMREFSHLNAFLQKQKNRREDQPQQRNTENVQLLGILRHTNSMGCLGPDKDNVTA